MQNGTWQNASQLHFTLLKVVAFTSRLAKVSFKRLFLHKRVLRIIFLNFSLGHADANTLQVLPDVNRTSKLWWLLESVKMLHRRGCFKIIEERCKICLFQRIPHLRLKAKNSRKKLTQNSKVTGPVKAPKCFCFFDTRQSVTFAILILFWQRTPVELYIKDSLL